MGWSVRDEDGLTPTDQLGIYLFSPIPKVKIEIVPLYTKPSNITLFQIKGLYARILFPSYERTNLSSILWCHFWIYTFTVNLPLFKLKGKNYTCSLVRFFVFMEKFNNTIGIVLVVRFIELSYDSKLSILIIII